MIATTNQDGSLNLFFPPGEAKEVLKAIQNPSLQMDKPENAGPKRKSYDSTKPERPTKCLRGKTIEALKEIRDVAGLQRISVKHPAYLQAIKSQGIRPGNFTQTLKTLEARGTVEIFMNDTGTQVHSFIFKSNFKI